MRDQESDCGRTCRLSRSLECSDPAVDSLQCTLHIISPAQDQRQHLGEYLNRFGPSIADTRELQWTG